MGFPGLQGGGPPAAGRTRRRACANRRARRASWARSFRAPGRRRHGDPAAGGHPAGAHRHASAAACSRCSDAPGLNYEPDGDAEFPGARPSSAAVTPLEALYDHLAGGDGSHLVYFPIFNYNSGSLDAVRQMLGPSARAVRPERCRRPRRHGLRRQFHHLHADALGAATGAQDQLPLGRAVEMLTRRNARYLGLDDRGAIAPGLRADLNLIDPQRLSVGTPALCATCRPAASVFCRRRRLCRHLGRRAREVRRDGESHATRARAGWCAWALLGRYSARPASAPASTSQGHSPKRDAHRRTASGRWRPSTCRQHALRVAAAWR